MWCVYTPHKKGLGGNIMLLGKVIGSVVSTRKDERLRGHKLLIVEVLTSKQNGELVSDASRCLVCADFVDAGKGDTVLLVEGSTARTAASDINTPIDACIIGIVDSIDL